MSDPARASGKALGPRARIGIALVVLLALAAGIYLGIRHWQARGEPTPTNDAYPALMATRLPDATGKQQTLDRWRGRILVVNFWATWCPPCREEMPALSRLQAKHSAAGVQMLGIAIDNADSVAAYARANAIAYPLLIGGGDLVELSRALGNPSLALPYTIVFDAAGAVRMNHLGRISEGQVDALLQTLATR